MLITRLRNRRRMGSLLRRRLGIAVGTLLLTARVAVAQEMDVPVAVQVPVLLRVLSFDRALRAKVGSELVIAVAFEGRNRASVAIRDEFAAAVKATNFLPLADITVRVVAIDLEGDADLAVTLRTSGARALYIPPLHASDLTRLTAAARNAGVLSLSGVSAYAARGVSVGVGLQDDRPQIIIHLAASRAEGTDFSAQLLQMSQVIR